MRVDKAIRWGSLPSGTFMCVWEFFSQPHDYFGALVLVCVTNLCASGYICLHIYVLCHQVLGIKAFAWAFPPSLQESLQFKWLIFISEGTIISEKRSSRSALNTWTDTQTPGVLLGYDYSSTVYTRPAWIKTKQGNFDDFIRLALLRQIHCGSESLPTLLNVKESALMYRGGSFFAEFSGRLTLVSGAGRFLLGLQISAKPKALNLMWSPVCVCARVCMLVLFSQGFSCMCAYQKMWTAVTVADSQLSFMKKHVVP